MLVTKKPKKNIRVPIKTVKCSPASFRYKTLSADKGIKGLFCCPARKFRKGKCSEGVKLVTAVYDGDKWTKAKATAHAKKTFKNNPKKKPVKHKKSTAERIDIIGKVKELEKELKTTDKFWERPTILKAIDKLKKQLPDYYKNDRPDAVKFVKRYQRAKDRGLTWEQNQKVVDLKKRMVEHLLDDGDDLFAKLAVSEYIEDGHSATEALKRYVDSVEGDVSQLPRKLADYAKDKGWI